MTILTEDQKTFILEHSEKHTIREMQDILNLKKQNIQYFINKNGLRYKQHKDCKYKEVVKQFDFDCCPITGFKSWN